MLFRVSGKAPMIKTIFKLLEMDSTTTTLSASPAGLKFNGVGASRVTFLNMDYPPAAFDKFECDSEVVFGVRPQDVNKVLARVKKDAIVTISVDFEDSKFIVSSDSKPPKSFKLPMVQGESESKPIPTLEYPVTLNAKTEVMLDIMQDADAIGATRLFINTVKPGVNFSGGKLTANDYGIGIYDRTFVQGEGVDVTTSPDAPVKQGYSMDYVKLLTTIISEEVESYIIQYGHNMPIRINFDHNGGDVLYYLAPFKETTVPAAIQEVVAE